MKTIAFFVGLLAVTLYFVGYLQKSRSSIIVINATSRLLYIIQYILLGAFEGAVLDIAGIISSLLAKKKDTRLIKKHLRLTVICVNILIVIMGLFLYENIFSILPIIGVLFHTGAFWMDNEKRIRQVSFLGSPFWLIYNFVSGAYGSCIGDILSMISLGISMIRYDLMPKNNNNKSGERNGTC